MLQSISTFFGNRKVKTKVILLILFIAYISILFVSIAVFIVSTRTIDSQIRNELSVTAENVMESVNKMIYERQTDLQLLINDSVLSNPKASSDEKSEVLKNVLFDLGLYDELYLTDENGYIIASTYKKSLGSNVSDAYWYKGSLDDFLFISDIVNSDFTNRKTLIISNMVFDKENTFLGVVVAEFSWEVIESILHHTQEHFDVFLADKDNHIIAQKIPEDMKPVESLDEIFEPQNQEKNIIIQIHSEGYQGFKGNDWDLIVQIPKEIAFAPINVFTIIMWIIVLVISVFALFIGNRFANKFVKPIQELTKGVSKIEHGQLNQKIRILNNDEFGFLAKNFNNMTSSLLEKTNNLLAEKGKYKSILESTNAGIILFNKQNQAIAYNKQFRSIFSLTEKEVTMKSAKTIFKKIEKYLSEKTSLKNYEKMINLISRKNFRKELKLEIVCSQEIFKIIQIYSKPVLAENGKLLGRIWVFNDVTEEKEAEKTKNDFISVASHKLRTPLTALNWTLQMFKDNVLGKVNQEQQKALSQLEVHTLRLDSLVKILMNAAEIKNNNIPVHKSNFTLKGTLDRIYEQVMKKSCNMKQIHLKLPSQKDLEKFTVKADKEKVKQVLQILIENACIYSKKDGENQIEISMKNDNKRNKVIISISDKGIGIPLQEQNKIFTKFFRGKEAITNYTEGTGLSLYLVKIIIQSHKEKIWFESQERRGSTFYFTLSLDN